jgi:hypothetical protein
LADQKDRELVKLSERIFDLFKNHTDGRNRGLEDISWRNVWDFALQRKMTESEVVETFRHLEKLDLIMPSPNQPTGYYRLTSNGQTEDVAHLIETRLRTLYSGATTRNMIKQGSRIIFLTCSVLGGFLVLLNQAFKLIVLPTDVGMVLGMLWIVTMIGAGAPLQSQETTIFFKLYKSYLSLKKGAFEEAEKTALEAAEDLQYSGEFPRSEWNIISKDVHSLTNDLGQEIRKRVLPAIHRNDPAVIRKLIELADVFANPSLERLRPEVEATVEGLKEDEYRPPGRIDRLAGNLAVHRGVHVLMILVIAAVLDLAVIGLLSLAENRQLSAYYLYIAVGYIPAIPAVIGLRQVILSIQS